MIDHVELEAIAEEFSKEDKKTRQSPFDFKEGYAKGFAKAVHLMEVIFEKRNWEEMNKYRKADDQECEELLRTAKIWRESDS